MATQMKMHNVLHRLLVCRLYHQQTNSPVELINQTTNETCLLHKTQPNAIPTRKFSRCLSRDTTSILHIPPSSSPGLTKESIRCASTSKTGQTKKKTSRTFSPLKLKNSRYVITPELASLMVDKIWNGDDITSAGTQGLIIDAKPGPGYITKELLNRGAKNVVAVERNKHFLPDLKKLAEESNGRLRTYYGEYFMLSDATNIAIKYPWVSITDVLSGVRPQPWNNIYPKFPVNVVGALPTAKEMGNASHLCNSLLQKQLQFRFGRVQHNLWMAERVYRIISKEPGGQLKSYTHSSAMYSICYNVKLLHVEPQSSFIVDGGPDIQKPANLYLVQLTPRLDAFDHGLTPNEMLLFDYFMRQILAHRRTSLKGKIEEWAPGHSDIIYDLNHNAKTRTGDVVGSDYLHIFKAIRRLDTFNGWMGDGSLACSHMALGKNEDVDLDGDLLEEEEKESIFADAIH